jgi:hypothetical protein
MISIAEVLCIIFIHWLADFVMQDEKWALGKSKNIRDLVSHTSMYTIVSTIYMIFLMYVILDKQYSTDKILYFMTITFVAHTATDYFTSRIVSKMFFYKKYGSPIPNFGAFTMIGIDQVLHYVQLFYTYQFINQ